MNLVFKKSTAEKVLAAIYKYKDQSLPGKKPTNGRIADKLGISVVTYLTMLRKETQFDKIPAHAWDKLRNFVNSGIPLVDYQYKAPAINEVTPIKVEPKGHIIAPDADLIPETAAERDKNITTGKQVIDQAKKDNLDALQGGKSEFTAASGTLPQPSPFIKEIITPGTPLNIAVKKAVFNVDINDQGQADYKVRIDIEVRVNGIIISNH